MMIIIEMATSTCIDLNDDEPLISRRPVDDWTCCWSSFDVTIDDDDETCDIDDKPATDEVDVDTPDELLRAETDDIFIDDDDCDTPAVLEDEHVIGDGDWPLLVGYIKAFVITLLVTPPIDNDKSSERPRYGDREFIIVIGNKRDDELSKKIGRTIVDGLDEDCDKLIIKGGKQISRGVNVTYDTSTRL